MEHDIAAHYDITDYHDGSYVVNEYHPAVDHHEQHKYNSATEAIHYLLHQLHVEHVHGLPNDGGAIIIDNFSDVDTPTELLYDGGPVDHTHQPAVDAGTASEAAD